MDKVTHLRNYAIYLKFVQNELDKLFEKCPQARRFNDRDLCKMIEKRGVRYTRGKHGFIFYTDLSQDDEKSDFQPADITNTMKILGKIHVSFRQRRNEMASPVSSPKQLLVGGGCFNYIWKGGIFFVI